VADEIEFCYRQLGVEDFAFYDDALLVDAENHLHLILDEVLDRGLSCRFHTPNGLHARFIDEALAAKMFRSGFKTIRLGLETSNEAEQRRAGAKVTNADFQAAVCALRDAGFGPAQITAYVLMGLPGQPVQEMLESIDFVHECGVSAQITLYSPIPGTAEWQRTVSQGLLDPRADPLLHNDSIYPFRWCPATAEDFKRAKAMALANNRNLPST